MQSETRDFSLSTAKIVQEEPTYYSCCLLFFVFVEEAFSFKRAGRPFF